MQSAELRGKRCSRAHLRTDKPITYRFTQPDNIAAPHGSNPEKSYPPRERTDEVIRPYGSNPDKSHRRFPIHPTGTRCRALICAEIKRVAIPKRRRSAPDDRAVLIASLVFSCEAALSSQRKIRGSRKRGYKKPQVSCTPFCPCPGRGASPPPKAAKKALALRGRNSPVPGNGVNLASCVRAAVSAENFALSLGERKRRVPSEGTIPASCGKPAVSAENSALSLGEKKGACPPRTHFPLFGGQLLRFSQQGEPQ